ncbi:MAG: endopeptidase La [Actinomycetota bacterium]|nr:endopeptidase La [Actinomycetota bacterium]
MSETQILTLPVLPLTAGVVGPTMVVTIALDEVEGVAAADVAGGAGGQVLLVPKRDGQFRKIGTIAKLEQDGELPNGTRAVVVRGLGRARLGAGRSGDGNALWVEATPVDDTHTDSPEIVRLANEYRAVVEEILERRGARQMVEAIGSIDDPGALADLSFYSPDLDLDDKIRVLETLDVAERLTFVLDRAKEALAELAVRDDVRRSVGEDLEKEQREALLRRQMAAIRSELGDGDDEDLVEQYRARLAESGAPENVVEAVERELTKLERTSAQSPEHSWIINWLDTVLEIPWSERAPEHHDLVAARAILDEDHAGLDEVKERIVEYLAVRKLRAEREVDPADRRAGPTILALVGPPGVGKTSLGESIARALERPFGRVALGGVHDESEIRGHRRTYVGSRAGRVVRAITEAGAMNPVLLLDEIDKVGSDWRGDPSSALLEVLDPAQNHTFRDHYLEVELDLSDVVFLATANTFETIPGPLLDRLEVITVDGYTEAEKVVIGREHLLPRLLRSTGIEPDEVTFTDEAVAEIVSRYTREAGVRSLERQLAKALRKVATRLADGQTGTVTVDLETLKDFLGKPRHTPEVAERTSVPGVATGLAVTGAGGDVLFVEAALMDGEPGLTLTGQLGDVMRESAEIARSYVRSHKDTLGLGDANVDGRRVHVHVPAGAIPKDGPSAGVTMTTAMVSLLTGRPVRHTVGMTGEVTLQGKVLPIGGVKQKVLAAHRAGLTDVILPARNEPDLDDIPDGVRAVMTIHLASDIGEVLAVALEDEPVGAGSEGPDVPDGPDGSEVPAAA